MRGGQALVYAREKAYADLARHDSPNPSGGF
jgi:hypothetical protein